MKHSLPILDLIEDFYPAYLQEKAKLPYHLNLLDEIHANENGHSKIFFKILSFEENDNFPFLESFLNFLNFDFKSLKVSNPVFTVEKYRIDILITDHKGDYAIIIENKIHGALDQKGQILRYIQQVQSLGFKRDKIFILYLTRDGGEPSSDSFSKDTRGEFNNRYLAINYRNFILPWLESRILPICRLKDNFLISAIQQYIDHLNGLFHQRTIDTNMNTVLTSLLTSKLNLVATNHENLNSINNYLTQVDTIHEYLSKFRIETVNSIFRKWQELITEKYPGKEIQSNLIRSIPDKNYFYIGIQFEYSGVKFLSAIGMDDYTGNPYYGITIRNCTDSKKPEILNWAQMIISDGTFKDSPRWYLWKEVESSQAFFRFTELTSRILNDTKIK